MSRYEELKARLEAGPRRWLVTGAAGFIGSHLTERLLSLGQHVVGLDNFSTGKRENLDDLLSRVPAPATKRFQFIEGDIRDPAACRTAMQGVELVLHEAALGSVPRSMENPLASHHNNVDGFVNVLLAAGEAKVERVVYASSSSVYGDDKDSPKVESRLGRPLSPYATTKLVDEIYADTFARTHGIASVGLRYFNVFGARQDPFGAYAAVIPRWTEALLCGERCVVFGDGTNSRDFCYIDNVVQANLLAACAPAADVAERAFNVACGARTNLLQLFDGIRNHAARFNPAAASVQLVHESPRKGDVPHSLANIELATTRLGYQPAFDLARGLGETVTWYARRTQRSRADSEPTLDLRPAERTV